MRFAVLTPGTYLRIYKNRKLSACRNGYLFLVQEMPLTCLRDLTAHSSRVSAASSLPCRRYRAPRFLRVVFTVGLDTETDTPIFTQRSFEEQFGPSKLMCYVLYCKKMLKAFGGLKKKNYC